MAKCVVAPIAVLVVIGLLAAVGCKDAGRGGSGGSGGAVGGADSVLVGGYGDELLGIWAQVGEENATFVISRDTIDYPDHGSAYTYRLVKDSLHIRYDGFDGNYLVQMKGADTLILVGEERSVYYRLKQ